MLISIATPGDAEAIAGLVNRAYRGTHAARGWTHEAALLDGQRTDPAMIRDTLEGGATILVVRDAADAAFLGCVSLEPGHGSGAWYLGMLTIDPAHQAQGLGRQLLDAAEAHARSRGAHRIDMTVIHLRDSLIAWYERRGYARTGAVAPFPANDARFGIPLHDDLHFVVLSKTF